MAYKLSLSLIAALLIPQVPVRADDARAHPQQSGDLNIEETDAPKRPPYIVTQDAALAWLDTVKSSVEQGGHTAIPELEQGPLQHLAVGYLYCITRLGTCEFILTTVLEADVINARGKSDNQCTIMTQFWKFWIQAELEKRVSYLAPVGSAAEIVTFNKTGRPRYLKCRDTIGQILAQTKDEAGWNARYSKDGELYKAIAKTKQVFDDAKARKLDLMTATGVGDDSAGGTAKTRKK